MATVGNWTISGGGASNVPPYIVTTKVFPGGEHPDLRSPGSVSPALRKQTGRLSPEPASRVLVTDSWTANCPFLLPSNAVNITLSYSNLYCDDRVVLLLNGSPIAATGIISTCKVWPAIWSLPLEDQLPLTRSAGDGSVSGIVTAGFRIGASNLVEAVANNTHSGIYGTNEPLTAGIHDQAIIGLAGTVSGRSRRGSQATAEPTTVSLCKSPPRRTRVITYGLQPTSTIGSSSAAPPKLAWATTAPSRRLRPQF